MAKLVDYYTGPDTASAQLMEVVVDASDKYTVLAAKLAAADGDAEAAYTAFIETSDEPQAVKLRAAIASATEKLNALAKEKVVVESLDEAARAKIKAELKAHADTIKNGRTTVLSVASMFKIDVEGVTKALDSIPNPLKRAASSGAKTGSSLPRVSAHLSVTGGNLKDEKYDNLAMVAKALNADVEELQKALANAGGVAHENISKVFDGKTSVTFTFKSDHPNASDYIIMATPKVRKPRGEGKTESDSAEGNVTGNEHATENALNEAMTAGEADQSASKPAA